MTDDFDTIELPAPRGVGPRIRSQADQLGVIADALTRTLDGPLDALDPSAASPGERAAVASVRGRLKDIEATAHSWGGTIDMLFKRSFAGQGARELPADGGVIRYEPGKSSYHVKDEALYRALSAFVGGELTQEELLEAVQPITTYQVNHTKLNALARNRGDAVREAIEANRVKVEPDPLSGRVVYPKGSDS